MLNLRTGHWSAISLLVLGASWGATTASGASLTRGGACVQAGFAAKSPEYQDCVDSKREPELIQACGQVMPRSFLVRLCIRDAPTASVVRECGLLRFSLNSYLSQCARLKVESAAVKACAKDISDFEKLKCIEQAQVAITAERGARTANEGAPVEAGQSSTRKEKGAVKAAPPAAVPAQPPKDSGAAR